MTETQPVRVALAGSTGSIGRQAVDVLLGAPDRFRVVTLGAHGSVDLLVEQARLLEPDRVVVTDPVAADRLRGRLPTGTELEVGAEALAVAVEGADVVLNAVVGFAGLGVTMASIRSGARLALANKESLIAAGPVVNQARAATGAEIVPVDSEHSAIHQCLQASHRPSDEVARIVLTASGGPFRGLPSSRLAEVTIDDALAHPTWSMGPKITVDSSTLMNKGLEVIEAHELFGVDYDRIEVVVHPQSIVHSMVEFSDGATVAQLSNPDMRLPISYALAYPDRWPTPHGRLDWAETARLEFETVDVSVFRCLALAYEAGRTGGCAPAWLSAANEVAVDSFLSGQLRWVDIANVVEEALAAYDGRPASTVDDVLGADADGRRAAAASIARLVAA